MKQYETILLSQQDKVATITINRPKVKNALDFDDMLALVDVLSAVAGDDGVRAIILTGAEGTFCAGADLSLFDDMEGRIEDVITRGVANVIQLIATIEKPVIAAVEGYAAGVGMSIALACDVMVMGESAKLFSPFIGISLIPDGGVTQVFKEKMGYQRAYEFFVNNGKLTGAECLEMGMANRIAANGEVQSSALEWATELSEKAPIALAALKRLMRKSLTYTETIAAEGEYQDRCSQSEDFKEGTTAFFEKRKPVFTGK